MALDVTIQLNVTPLTDNEIWFADAEAWSNYWRNIELQATFEGADNDVYTPVNFDNGLPYLDISGGVGMVPTQAQFQSLLADYVALKANYEEMRTAMKTAGFLQEAQ